MLTTVAEAKTTIGRHPASRRPRSENSRPIATHAKIRNQVRRSLTVVMVALSPPHCRYSVPMTDAAMKPRTNLGKRSQNCPMVGRASLELRRSTLSAKYAVNAIATTPISAFCVVFTMVAICRASSPAIAPEAATAAVVSMLPPIQAPATASDSPRTPASQGSRKIDGSAKTITSDAAYASCSRWACTAPAAAIAALIPQIDTAEASSARSLSSMPSRPPSHHVKPNTMLMSSNAWMIAGPAAVASTFRLIDAPRSTRPVLMKNSVRNPADNASRSANRDSTTLPSSPSAMA